MTDPKTPQANRMRFRVWHKTLNCMYPVTRLGIFEGRELNDVYFDSEKGEISSPAGECIVMQSIGLLDQNGKEIFEGDVVRAASQGVWRTVAVKWRQEAQPCWILWPAYEEGKFWKLHGSQRGDGTWYDDVEIIGNIYENPELLPAK